MPVGSIAALWRYPVKSMQGEEVNGAFAAERGLLGDRTYAVLDKSTGFVASIKHPGKWGRLLECRAAFVAPPQPNAPLPPLWITLPDGTVLCSTQSDIDTVLSALLEREVSLISEAPATPTREADRTPFDGSASGAVIKREQMALAAPEHTFFDYAPLHLLTTATLDKLRELYPSGRFEARRFRPNIIITPLPDEPDFVENRWLGNALRIGEQVRLRMIDPCPRCVVPTLAQSDLPRDPGILRAVVKHNSAASVTLAPGVVFPGVAGAYASVLDSGSLRRGETVWLDA